VKEEVSPTYKIVHQTQKLPWPIWSRDILLNVVKYYEGDVGYVLLTSRGSDNSKYPCDTANYVRAIVHISTFIFEPTSDPNKSKFTRCLNVDPAGNIPTAVVNSQASAIYASAADLNNKVFKS